MLDVVVLVVVVVVVIVVLVIVGLVVVVVRVVSVVVVVGFVVGGGTAGIEYPGSFLGKYSGIAPVCRGDSCSSTRLPNNAVRSTMTRTRPPIILSSII